MKWTELQYAGTALTDALLMINLLSVDWGELGQSLTGASDFLDWTIGEYQWETDAADRSYPIKEAGANATDCGSCGGNSDADSDADSDTDSDTVSDDSPYLGCNVDRMGHVPKGIHAIRMDGVDNVVFDGLTISGIQESSPLGSELC